MRSFLHIIRSIFSVFLDASRFLRLCLRPTVAVAAENLFLRKQLGLYVEREVKARRATDSIRFTLARLSRVLVQIPMVETLQRMSTVELLSRPEQLPRRPTLWPVGSLAFR